MVRHIHSQLKLVIIQINRFLDHFYRFITGFPTLRQSEITPRLYLGGQYNLQGMKLMKKLGITGVVNMRSVSIHKDTDKLHFRYLHLPTRDQHAPTLQDLRRGVKFIQQELDNGGKVYVHCRQGEGRGPTMAIAYLMSTGILMEDAIAHIAKFRTFIRPTMVQREQLKRFAEELEHTIQ